MDQFSNIAADMFGTRATQLSSAAIISEPISNAEIVGTKLPAGAVISDSQIFTSRARSS
jgi:hypothetical protein